MSKKNNQTIENVDLSKVSLEEIAEETLFSVLKLNVSEHQKKFVAPNSVSIAQAYFSDYAWFRAIAYDGLFVGFVMLHDEPEKPEYFLWRFMIDEKYQGNGFGKRALELLVDYVKKRPDATELYTSCVPGEGSPSKFYEKFGFVETGEKEENEDVYLLKI